MADKTDDASNGAEQPKLSFQEQMAEVKRNSHEVEEDDASGAGDNGADGSDDANKGAEGTDNASGDNDGAGDGGDSQDDGSGGDDDSGSDDAGNDDGQFTGRFTQFKGDGTQEDYIKKLEEGYTNSSQEAIKIKDDRDGLERQVNAIKQAAATDPKFGERLLTLLNSNGGDGGSNGSDGKSDDLSNKTDSDTKNPFLKDAETNWNKESEKEAKEFTDANPEVLTDPKINAEVKRWMRVFSNETYEAEGRLMKAGEAMRKAYAYLGYEDKTKETQDLVNGLKQQAAPTRPQAAKKKPSGSGGGQSKQFSDLTLSIASRMNISKERLAKGSKR